MTNVEDSDLNAKMFAAALISPVPRVYLNGFPELSDTGDDCHYNIFGVSNPRLLAVFINRALSDFSIVDGGIIRPLELADMQ